MTKFDVLLQTIGRAALDREAWFDVLEQTADHFGASSVQMAVARHGPNPAFECLTPRIPELDQGIEDVAVFSEPVLYTASRPNWRRFVDYDFIDESGMNSSVFYDHNAGYDIRYRLGLNLLDDVRTSTALVWMWPKRAGHVQQKTLRDLDRIEGALRVAAYISEHAGPDIDGDLRTAVEGMQRPTMILDHGGWILCTNTRGELLLRRGSAITSENGYLVASRSNDRTRFARFLYSVCAPSSEAGTAASIATGGGAERPVIAHAIRLPRSTLPIGRCDGRVMLVFNSEINVADGLYALVDARIITWAEHDVAALFLKGLSAPQIAIARGVSVDTVRTQIKAIQTKLGVSGQVELATFISTL